MNQVSILFLKANRVLFIIKIIGLVDKCGLYLADLDDETSVIHGSFVISSLSFSAGMYCLCCFEFFGF
jgi:hypothetical protein